MLGDLSRWNRPARNRTGALRASVTGLGALLLGAVLLVSSPASADAAPQTPQRYIVMYEGSVTDPTGSTVGRERRDGFRSYARFRQLKGFAAGLTERQVATLRRDASVELVARDLPTQAAGVPLAGGESVPPA